MLGEFLLPTTKSISAAVLESKAQVDLRASLTNAPGKESYPITSFTWLYIPVKSKDPERGRAVSAYLKWIYGQGQQIAQDRGYATLPENLRAKVIAATTRVR